MKSTWKLDQSHSELLFKVKHLMISNVKGEFKEFDVQVESPEQGFHDAKVHATIQADSIFTNNTDRDNHLKSDDFFNAEQYPTLEFTSTSMEKLDEENYRLKGELTMKGVTKNVVLEVNHGGTAKDPYGNTKAGFSISGKINRKDFGLNWNQVLETGGVMVSDEVRINGEIQLALAENKAPASA